MPTTPPPSQSALVELVALFGRLRVECGWKRAQTHRTLARYLLEEAYETVEAIESGTVEDLRDELGDVLLQVYLHAAIAAEAGQFDIEDVALALREKMIRRNPHVFARDDAAAPPTETDPERINEVWQAVKDTEKRRTGLLEGVPQDLPALLRAVKLLDRAERAGVAVAADAHDPEVGERLLALVAEARSAGLDPEQELREAVRRHAE